MTAHDELDERLRQHYAASREGDARQAPPFAEMIARARSASPATSASPALAAEAPQVRPALSHRTATRPRRWVWALAATPLAVAAALAAILLSPARSADRDFERTVAEWSRLERSITLPSDGLLAVPGSELLRRLPVLSTGDGATRRPM